MPLQNSKNILEKINALYKSISIDDKVSSIERDLMLSYIRQFYESFLNNDINTNPAKTPTQNEPVQKKEEGLPPNTAPKEDSRPTPSAPVIEYIVEKPKEIPTPPPTPKVEVKPIVKEEPPIQKSRAS